MAALLRLLQLSGIADQDEALGRLGYRQSIRERELASLVDEENVDGSGRIPSSPDPGCPAEHLRGSTSKGIESLFLMVELADWAVGGRLIRGDAPRHGDNDSLLLRGL